jgi:hypothetical protein
MTGESSDPEYDAQLKKTLDDLLEIIKPRLLNLRLDRPKIFVHRYQNEVLFSIQFRRF